jgi:hypothetical protein
MAQDTQKNENKLDTFIEDNYKLLSILGVFTALTVFATSITVKWIAYVLSFLFLTETILIWLELWAKFPKLGINIIDFNRLFIFKLFLFKSTLLLSTLVLIGYWLLAFRIIWRFFLFLPIAYILIGLITKLLKNKLYNTVHSLVRNWKGRGLIKGFILIVYLAILIISFILATLLSPPINKLIEAMERTLQNTTP